MRTLTALAATAILALTTTACSNETTDTRDNLPDHEHEFLNSVEEALRKEGIATRYLGKDDTEKLEFGYAVCEDIEAGIPPTEVVQSIAQAGDGNTPMADIALPLVGNAEIYLCNTDG